jgi:hypothetical protein
VHLEEGSVIGVGLVKGPVVERAAVGDDPVEYSGVGKGFVMILDG